MDSNNQQCLEQAKELLSILINSQEHHDKYLDLTASAAVIALNLECSSVRFQGKSMMLTHLKNLEELLNNISEN